jgi:hypothetical protein
MIIIVVARGWLRPLGPDHQIQGTIDAAGNLNAGVKLAIFI